MGRLASVPLHFISSARYLLPSFSSLCQISPRHRRFCLLSWCLFSGSVLEITSQSASLSVRPSGKPCIHFCGNTFATQWKALSVRLYVCNSLVGQKRAFPPRHFTRDDIVTRRCSLLISSTSFIDSVNLTHSKSVNHFMGYALETWSWSGVVNYWQRHRMATDVLKVLINLRCSLWASCRKRIADIKFQKN